MPKQSKTKTLTATLRQAMIDSGHSDYAIVKAAGVAQPIITRFRNGTRDTIRLATADKIAAFLEYSLAPNQVRRGK